MQAAKIMYETIMSHLKTVVLANRGDHRRTLREKVLAQHDAFLATRTSIYVRTDDYMDTLNKHISLGKNMSMEFHIVFFKTLLMGGFYIYINLGILSLCTEP